jgi:hypothetical protein
MRLKLEMNKVALDKQERVHSHWVHCKKELEKPAPWGCNGVDEGVPQVSTAHVTCRLSVNHSL